MITVTVPATSANVGAGFDSLGLALSMHNVFTFEECDRIRISSVDGTHVPTGANNLVYRSARAVYDQLGIPLRGLRITQRNDIPMARGLGSSSACIVAGILGANALLGNKLTSRQMLTLATAIEGHPDNVAPAMLGGFVTSVYDEGQVYSVKKNIDEQLAFAAFVPDFRLLTSKARAALPDMVSHKDAVYNLSRAALATAAFCDGDYSLLGVATKDSLHQKYRLPLIDGGDEMFELAQDLGALALGLSTDFFPWRTLCSIRKPFSTFFMQIQFPWRFVGMAVPMLSAAAAWGYLREEKDAKTGMAALIALCVVFSGYTMQTMVQRLPELEKETYTDTRIGQFEYTYPCTEKTALKVGDVRTSQPGICNVLSYEKRGTELTATVQLEGEAAYIELPLLYYPGYRAEIDGQAQTVARGTNNMVRVYGLSSGESGTVHVWYQPPTAWLIAQGVSALGALLLAASLRRMRRRA